MAAIRRYMNSLNNEGNQKEEEEEGNIIAQGVALVLITKWF